MLEVFGREPASPSGETAIARVLDLEDALRQAPDEGLVSAVPTETPVAVSGAGSEGARVRTIRNRLHRLGYLADDTESPQLDADLEGAIRAFQSAARLTVDGWVGEKTWGALQELVSFEEATTVDRWLEDDTGEPMPAFMRAAGLRLSVLGLLDEDARLDQAAIGQALIRLGRVMALLGVPTGFGAEPFDRARLQVLFDHDGMVERLSGARDFGQRLSQRTSISGAPWRAAAGLLVNVVKIELWLGGYAVDLRRPDYGVLKRKPQQSYRLEFDDDRFIEAVRRFWTNVGRGRDDLTDFVATRRKRARAHFLREAPLFLARVCEDNEDFDGSRDVERSQEIADWYRDNPEHVETSVEEVKTLRSRLWDGIKRVWSWIKGVFRTIADGLAKFAREIASVAHHFANGSFQRIWQAVTAVASGARFVFSRITPNSDPRHIAIMRGSDFDYTVMINADGDPDEITKRVGRLNRVARIVALACEIIGVLAGFVLRTLRRGFLTGGFALFFSLIDAYKVVRRLIPLAEQLSLEAAT